MNGDLELDLQELMEAVGQACRSADTGLVMIVDEPQYVAEEELAALVVALHRTAQRQLPVMLLAAGLPQLRGRLGRAKSYAERLFDFPTVGPLPPDAAAQAITKPAAVLGINYADPRRSATCVRWPNSARGPIARGTLPRCWAARSPRSVRYARN